MRSPRERAWIATTAAFSNRLCHLVPPGDSPETDFDVEYVIAATPLPRGNSHSAHEAAWDQLRRVFDREWNANRRVGQNLLMEPAQ